MHNFIYPAALGGNNLDHLLSTNDEASQTSAAAHHHQIITNTNSINPATRPKNNKS
jgi:hypothetical protein